MAVRASRLQPSFEERTHPHPDLTCSIIAGADDRTRLPAAAPIRGAQRRAAGPVQPRLLAGAVHQPLAQRATRAAGHQVIIPAVQWQEQFRKNH